MAVETPMRLSMDKKIKNKKKIQFLCCLCFQHSSSHSLSNSITVFLSFSIHLLLEIAGFGEFTFRLCTAQEQRTNALSLDTFITEKS